MTPEKGLLVYDQKVTRMALGPVGNVHLNHRERHTEGADMKQQEEESVKGFQLAPY